MKKLLLFAILATAISANAQSPVLEKTYDVSGKAKRGMLGGVEVDKEKGTINMYYMLPSFFEGAGNPNGGWFSSGFKKEIPCEVYSYDKDLNQKDNFTTGVAPKSYDWARYNGIYTREVVKAWFSLGGLQFQKQSVKYDYDPQRGTYLPGQWKVLDKEKPRQSDGVKYSFLGGFAMYDVIANSTALLVAGKKVEKSEATKKNYLHAFNHMMHYDVIKCDFDLKISVTDSFDFEYANVLSFNKPLKDQRMETNDELPRDLILISIASYQSKPGFLYQAPNPTSYTYIRINPQGKIVDKISFDSPANGWNIEGAYEQNNAVYIYGTAILKDRETKNTNDLKWGKVPFTHYQIGKISKGKFDFLKVYSLKDMQAVLHKPTSQKKMLELTGENEGTTDITVVNNGDIYISYQNYEKVGDNNAFRNMFMFQFDASGELKKNFGIELKNDHSDKGPYLSEIGKPFKNYFFPSVDGKKLYWFISSPKEMACTGHATADYSTVRCWPLLGIDYTSINIETGELSEMKTIANEKKNPFYIFCTTKPRQMGDYVYFFSENAKENGKGGDEIKITRVDISK